MDTLSSLLFVEITESGRSGRDVATGRDFLSVAPGREIGLHGKRALNAERYGRWLERRAAEQ